MLIKNTMAGHSKWANIKHKKAATDAKRAKIWTRLIREITVASKLGGAEVPTNPRLRLAIDKAMDANMPKDNISRAIARGIGGQENTDYQDVRYEGYGMAGAAIIVDCMTDNRTRTVAEVRHAFNKYGGNMGTEGSVAFMFDHVGVLFFEGDADIITELALEYEALDVIETPEGVEVITPPYEYSHIKEQFAQQSLIPIFSQVGMKPKNEIELDAQDAEKMQKLLDALENLDDVQDVYSNAVNPLEN